jgi:hypothetical protein
MKDLIPPDPKQCQCEVTPAYSIQEALQIGNPRRGPARCTNPTSVIATERFPGGDGRRGAMSLCESCHAVFVKKHGDVADIVPVTVPK